MTRAVLDACVLYPTILREILTDVAAAGLYQPVWSPRILTEWVRAAARNGQDQGAIAQVESVQLQARFPDAVIDAPEDLARGLDLPDPADAHVVAAAMAAGAARIVTANLRDFPRRALPGIEAIHPDSFLTGLWAHHPDPIEQAARAAHRKANDLGSGMEFKAMLKRARLPRLARAITRISG